MTNCTQESFQFPAVKRRRVEASFQGGNITSDGGVLLLQQVDRRLGLSEAIARVLDDPRRQASCDHDNLRLKLLKIGAVILRNTRRIRFLLSSTCPYQQLFLHVAAKLVPG